jgi:cytochrome c biogenesis protein ResB
MLKLSLKAAAGFVLAMAGIVCLMSARQAEARPQYLPVWLQTYPDVAEKNTVKATVKCNVCHSGASKKNRNEYGKAIEKVLDGKKNVKDKTKIADILKTAAKEKNADGKPFGDLLDANELPAKAK